MAGIFTTRGRREPFQPGVSFIEMREGLCKLPLGAKDDPPLRFCGEPTQPGSVYCPQCRAIAYRRPDTRVRRVIGWIDRKA